MDIQRIELKGGGWAMAHHRPSHGQMKAFYRSFRGKPETEMMDTQDELILILCEEWAPHGAEPSKPSRASIDEAPQDVVTDLCDKLAAIINSDGVPPGEA